MGWTYSHLHVVQNLLLLSFEDFGMVKPIDRPQVLVFHLPKKNALLNDIVNRHRQSLQKLEETPSDPEESTQQVF